MNESYKKMFIGENTTVDFTGINTNGTRTGNMESPGNNTLSGNPTQLQKSGIFTDDFNAFINLPSTILTPAFGSLGIIDAILTLTVNYTNIYIALKDKLQKLSDIISIFNIISIDTENYTMQIGTSTNEDIKANLKSKTMAYRSLYTRNSIYAHMALSEKKIEAPTATFSNEAFGG